MKPDTLDKWAGQLWPLSDSRSKCGETGWDLMPTITYWRGILARSTAAERETAEHWYQAAAAQVNPKISDYLAIRQACVVSHLSVRMEWSHNVKHARHLMWSTQFIATKPAAVMNGPWNRAMMSWQDIDPLSTFQVGSKTHQFALALAGDGEACVIDTHMIHSSMIGSRPTYNSLTTSHFTAATQMLTPVLRDVAREYDYSTCGAQAAIWLAHKVNKW